jgi:hypothetical protein
MKVVFASDLHADFNQPKIEWPAGDVCVIGGDTGNSIGTELKVLGKLAKKYRHVVTTDGNHTHYSNAPQKRTVEETIRRIRAQLPANVHFLGHGNPSVEIEGVWFVGCMGWYSFDVVGDVETNKQRWRRVMNDCRWIGFDEIEQRQPWDRARDDADLVRDTLRDIKAKAGATLPPIVVMTHTAPHRDMITWKDHDPEWNASNPFYVNSHMQAVLESPDAQGVTIWVNGHTHHRREKMINGIYCICNPRGYPSENPGWEPVVLPVIL